MVLYYKCNPKVFGSRLEIIPFFFVFVSFPGNNWPIDTILHIPDTIMEKGRRLFPFQQMQYLKLFYVSFGHQTLNLLYETRFMDRLSV